MSKWPRVRLCDINEFQGEIVDPTRFPTQSFELYSVPACELGKPEIVPGSSIGSAKQRVKKGDILLCKINPRINRVWVVEQYTHYPLIASSEWIVIRSHMATSGYLSWCLRSKPFREKMILNTTGIGGSLTRAQPKTVAQYYIPLPLITEQKTIAATLDTVSEVLRLHKAQLAELDNLVKSKFVEMFGDPMINSHYLPIVELGSVLTAEPQNGLYKPQSEYATDKNGTPILRIDGFYNGKVTDFRRLKRLYCSSEDIRRYLLRENDIVINRVNSVEYLGKCGLIQGIVEDTVFESNMMRIHVDESKFDACFVTHLLCTEYFYRQVMSRAKKAVNQASINQKDVQSFCIYMPPLSLQKKFSDVVEYVDKSKVVVQKALNETQRLFDSLMAEYFEE